MTAEHVGTTELWAPRLWLPQGTPPHEVQRLMADCAQRRGHSLLGYYQHPRLLTLLHWPGEQEGYIPADVDQSDEAMLELKGSLGAISVGAAAGLITLHAMLGWHAGEYGQFVSVDLPEKGLPRESIQRARMISARVRTDGTVEQCAGRVGIITAGLANEDKIHELASIQDCYTIERGPAHGRAGQTDFYRTIAP